MAEPRRIGLIVNPVAGIGGALAARGSDHFASLTEALAQGGVPVAEARARRALQRLFNLCPGLGIICADGPLGASAAVSAGYAPLLLDGPFARISSAGDTRMAAAAMIRVGVELILFAGGDGTARDIFEVTGDRLPLIGIPTGVKMHSAVLALSPEAAGESAALALGSNGATRLAEIMDADEAELVAGRPSARLFGYARTPDLPGLFQPAKAGRPGGGEAAIEALGRKLARETEPDRLVIFGPGTTMAIVKRVFGLTWALTPLWPAGHLPLKGRDRLVATARPIFNTAYCGEGRASSQSPPLRGRCPAGQRGVSAGEHFHRTEEKAISHNIESSLLGVDAIVDGKLIARDATAATLEALCETYPDVSLLVGIVGGQGFVFGRGNQQISPKVLRSIRPPNLRIIATREKLLALPSAELRIDTGDVDLDRALEGYHRVDTGPNDTMMMRLKAGT